MSQTAERISELRAKGRRAAVATLIATTGGAIRRLGETMWVDDDGAIVGSVTIGGCVDGRAVELAEEVLRTGTSRRVSLPLGDEDAWAFGMTCAGNVDLLVEPVDVLQPTDPVAVANDALNDAVVRGVAAIEVVSLGETPRRLIVHADGGRVGTLGSSALDGELASRATSLIDARASGVISVTADGTTAELFVQVHAPLPSLIVVGATDVAIALVHLAKPLGFHTTVMDGRERWANRDRFPTADALLVGMPSELLASMSLAASNALVLVSHDFKYDLPALEVALRSPIGYIGVLGSQRRANAIREFLSGIGASEADVSRVHIPIGLDIGARAPAEIALSIVAELIALRSGRLNVGAG
jgi:xanthine dehydrogenase accessory factor